MNSTKLWMTAQNPSRFGMPTTGCALGATTAARAASIQGTTVSAVVAIDGHTGLAKSYFPGTTAWRPPSC